MFSGEMLIEVERRVIAKLDERAKAGLPAIGLDSLRAIVRADLMKELEAERQASMRPVAPPAPPRAAVPPRPVAPVAKPIAPSPAPRPIPAVPKPRPVVLPKAAPVLSPAEMAERTRVQRIRAMAPTGAEAEVAEAIRSGMAAAEFEGVLAARMILASRRLVEGSSTNTTGAGRDAGTILLDAVRRSCGR